MIFGYKPLVLKSKLQIFQRRAICHNVPKANSLICCRSLHRSPMQKRGPGGGGGGGRDGGRDNRDRDGGRQDREGNGRRGRY